MDHAQKRIAQTAGISLIAMALIAGFGYGYAFESLYKDPANAGWLLRCVIISFTAIVVLDIIAACTLYVLFKGAGEGISLITVSLRLVYSAMLGASIFHLSPVTQDMNSLHAFLHAWSLSLIIFGCHLFLLGVVLKRSGVVPKAISYLALFAGACYILTNIANLVLPFYEHYKSTVDMILALPMALGELVLAVWLIRQSRITSSARSVF